MYGRHQEKSRTVSVYGHLWNTVEAWSWFGFTLQLGVLGIFSKCMDLWMQKSTIRFWFTTEYYLECVLLAIAWAARAYLDKKQKIEDYQSRIGLPRACTSTLLKLCAIILNRKKAGGKKKNQRKAFKVLQDFKSFPWSPENYYLKKLQESCLREELRYSDKISTFKLSSTF